MSPRHPILLSATLLAIATGAGATTVTIVRFVPARERTAGLYLGALAAFAGLAALASLSRDDRISAVVTLLAASVAAGAATVWGSGAFGEWTGIALLMLLPLEWACVIVALATRLLRYGRGRSGSRQGA